MPTIDLTDAEHAAVTALIRGAIQEVAGFITGSMVSANGGQYLA
jgi:hypothetical protein